MIKAWGLGIVILLVSDVVWLIALQPAVFSGVFIILMQVSPFIASSTSAYLAPRNKICLATSLAIPAALLILVLNFMYQIFGRGVDFPGLRGGLILFIITLLYCGVLCVLGGIAGYFLSKGRGEKKADNF